MAKKPKESVLHLVMMAMIFALTVVLMVLEGMIPPVPALPPGVKLGLSNIMVMYCLFFFGKGEAVTLLLLKTLFVFLTRGATAFFMSFAGGFLSIFILILLLSLKKQKFSYIIISVCAAVGHNVGQLAASAVLMQSESVFYYAPVLVLSGVAMGVVTGTLLRVMLPAMQRLEGKFRRER